MRITLLRVSSIVLCTAIAVASESKVPGAAVLRSVSGCTRIEVEDVRLGSPDGLPPSRQRHATISTKSDVASFISQLALADEMLHVANAVEFYDESGKVEKAYPPCDCQGDFELVLFNGEEELLRLMMFHSGEHIVAVQRSRKARYDLYQPQGARADAFLRSKIQRANQPAPAQRP